MTDLWNLDGMSTNIVNGHIFILVLFTILWSISQAWQKGNTVKWKQCKWHWTLHLRFWILIIRIMQSHRTSKFHWHYAGTKFQNPRVHNHQPTSLSLDPLLNQPHLVHSLITAMKTSTLIHEGYEDKELWVVYSFLLHGAVGSLSS